MADISTGRQRGIVPFVDETTGRLPDQYLPQGVIDLQGDLEQAVTNASASATEAKASAASATQSASAAAQSAESASGDAAAAKASETAAASSATAAANSEVAAKESETAASQSAQTATEQVSSIGDSVERAAASATAAQQSATEAASSASNASQSASSASTSASQASGFASTASQAATTATGAASNASESATTAQQSASEASASASAAKVSETNAAASATAAQQAVDGFGLEVGTTTTGEPGSDAAVSIVKQGTKYVADFTIPQGPQGPQGPKGDPGDLTAVTHDDTLTGDGTGSNPLGAGIGSALNPYGVSGAVDANAAHDGVMAVTYNTANLPTGPGTARGFIIGHHGGLGSPRFAQLLVSCAKGITPRIFARGSENSTFDEWTEFAAKEDIPDVSALTSRVAALETKMNELAVTQTRLQALEARVKSLDTNQ